MTAQIIRFPKACIVRTKEQQKQLSRVFQDCRKRSKDIASAWEIALCALNVADVLKHMKEKPHG